MIFTCETKALAAAMAIAGRVVPQKAHIPIIQHVRLATNDDRVTVTGTSMDTSFQMDVTASVATEGEVCLPFSTLRDFVGRAKGAEISIEVDGTSATIKSGRNRIGLMTQPAEDFPDIAPIDGNPVTVDAPAFCHALRFCSAAAATEDAKWNLRGVWFQESDDGSDFVVAWGTNGSHLHRAQMPFRSIGSGGIVPTEAAATILSIAEKTDTAQVVVAQHGWSVVAGGVRSWGKCVDGQFPDLVKIVNSLGSWSEVASAEHGDMAEGIDVAACGADADSDKSRATILDCDPGAEAIIVRGLKASAGVSHAGRAEVTASVSAPMKGAFNSAYLRAAMVGLKVPRVAIYTAERASDGMRSIQIRPAQDDANVQMEATVMSMRVADEVLADV